MPIVINEIEVAVTVADHVAEGSNTENSSSKEEIVKLCVEHVMAILNQKNER